MPVEIDGESERVVMEREALGWLGSARSLLVAAVFALGWSATAAAQTITEYPTPTANSGPAAITTGPDGALWFTEGGANQIGRVTTTASFTEYPIPTARSNPFGGIATGSDGALWFPESGVGKIGRVTPAGVFTEYPIASAPFIGGIAAGSDGALWFTEEGGASGSGIGRITTAGAVTEYALSLQGYVSALLNGITAGPDGALWFAESKETGGSFAMAVPFIGRITTAGVITEYQLLANGSSRLPGFATPESITAGSDGALWFVDQFTQIGRITTAGSSTLYGNPNNAYQDGGFGITSGPDGAIWFTEDGCSGCNPVIPPQIGRITTAGAFSQYAVPSVTSQPTGITAGPNNSIWFTESGSGGSKIGTFPVATLTVSPIGSGSGQITSSPSGINCSPSANACVAGFIAGTQVTLTASAGSNSAFTGWSGGGCSGTAPCTVTLGSSAAVSAEFDPLPSFTLSVTPGGAGSGTVTSTPSGINCGTTCNASYQVNTQVMLTASAASGSTFAGWSGGGCSGTSTCAVTMTANTTVTASFAANSSTGIALVAAALPLSRSALVGGTPATAFATILNAGPGTASTCAIAPATSIPASFIYQTTDPTTNALTGTANTPVNITQGAGQSFVIAFTPNAAFAPTNVLLTFGCANASPAPQIVGIDTLNLSASTTPVPDIVALAASGDPGYVDLPGATGAGDFAVATVNVGATSQITASANTGTANLPVTLTICQTNPASGACLAAPAPNVTTTIAANGTQSFGIFVAGLSAVADLPGLNRVFVTFTDANGILRGETSVAVRTQ